MEAIWVASEMRAGVAYAHAALATMTWKIVNSINIVDVMCNQLKTLSANQLEHLIKKAIDKYHGEIYRYTIKDLSSPNVNSTEKRLTFKVEIKCGGVTNH